MLAGIGIGRKGVVAARPRLLLRAGAAGGGCGDGGGGAGGGGGGLSCLRLAGDGRDVFVCVALLVDAIASCPVIVLLQTLVTECLSTLLSAVRRTRFTVHSSILH